MIDLLRAAVRRLRSRGRRGLLAFAGILLAGAMAGASITVAYGLHTGFDRSAASSDLPDVIADFADQSPRKMDDLLTALPNVAAVQLRVAVDKVRISGGTGTSRRGQLVLVDPTGRKGRKGYTVVAGRDLHAGDDEGVLIEQGLATTWGLEPGDQLDFGRRGPRTIVGVVVAPDNVAYPLAAVPRVYESLPRIERLVGGQFPVNQALVWTVDPARTNITLQQARATAADVKDLRFVTRAGVRVLIDGAAGIVVALLVAFSVVALGAAGVMLAAQASADVQRQLGAIGVQRAIGVRRGRVAGEHAIAAGMLGLVAGGLGVLVGALILRGPSGDLLAALSELPPGSSLVLPLVLAVVAIVLLVAAAAGVPAWRAAGRAPVALLRGAELRGRSPKAARRSDGAGRSRLRGATGGGTLGWLGLGARLALARRGRAGLSVGVLAASAALVLLMLGLASLVVSLRDDPGSLGKRYALTVTVPGTTQAEGRRDLEGVAGVQAVSPRYQVQGVDSYALGEPIRVIAFPGDHTRFEDPPLDSGRRISAPDEAEIGTGLASALGVGVGGVLAVQLADGGEARFRVVGTVRALDTDGRVAYVEPQRLLAASPDLEAPYAVRLDPKADLAVVSARLREIGAQPTAVSGATTQSGPLLATLAALLRGVAIIDVLVCLYALGQSLALTARERRPTLALLRATGASWRTVLLILCGAALVLAVPAALLAVPIEALLLAPLVTQLAAGYADLGGGATAVQAVAVVVGFAVLALVAAVLVTRRSTAEPPVAGLREE